MAQSETIGQHLIKAASDANLPCLLNFPLDSNGGDDDDDDENGVQRKVIDICCGSHHTAMLMDDGSVYGVGIGTGTKVPVHKPVQLIPPGVVEMPVRHFEGHFDRTTIVGSSGQQVLQVHLMAPREEEETAGVNGGETNDANDYGYFTPAWVDRLIDHDPTIRIQEVHRGWLHTVIVTEHEHKDVSREQAGEGPEQENLQQLCQNGSHGVNR